MCGIAGIFSPQGNRVDPAVLLKMTNSIRHRGPDDEGFLLVDVKNGALEPRRGDDTISEVAAPHLLNTFAGGTPNLALGYRRLSIIDLSPTGHQPMSNSDVPYGSSSTARFTTTLNCANSFSRKDMYSGRKLIQKSSSMPMKSGVRIASIVSMVCGHSHCGMGERKLYFVPVIDSE